MGTRITRAPGDPAIPHGTYYWSCPGSNFIPNDPDVQDVRFSQTTSKVTANADNIPFAAPVFLPQGAVVTAAEVFGNAAASAETWELYRAPLTTSIGQGMAAANINTEDNTIFFPTIDNNAYCYWFRTSSLDTGDEIWGARITYTI